MRLTPPPAAAAAPTDVQALLRRLRTDATPRLTWYGPDRDGNRDGPGNGDGDGADYSRVELSRVELSGRVLHTWVAKTCHLLLEEADVVPGSRVLVHLGPDWRAPVFWLAAWYLGAHVLHAPEAAPADVAVLGQDEVLGDPQGAGGTAGVLVVVPRQAVAAPLAGLPPGCVDYGGEVSGFPDELPAPGPRRPIDAPATGARRVLLSPDVHPGTAADRAVAAWAGGGSVVLHAGLPPEALARVVAQEGVDG